MSYKSPLSDPQGLFRFWIVSTVKALELRGYRRSAAVRSAAAAAAAEDFHEATAQCSVSERTIYRWLSAFKHGGIEGLQRSTRQQLEGSLVLSDKLLSFLQTERQSDRDASIPELLRRAEQYGIVPSAEDIVRSTAWRAMVRKGLETSRRKQPSDADMRRFRYAERMQMALLDFKHFRAGVTRAKRAAVYILDDATRYGMDVRATTSERAYVVLTLLHGTISRFGLMDLIYWDGGSGFKDGDVLAVVANLGIHPITGRAHYPEGHGAIEAFNRALKQREVRTYDGAPHIDPDCGALTLRLRHDLHLYNNMPHEALGGDTPWQRWTQSKRDLRAAPSQDWLRQCFTVELKRRVSKDHIVKVDSILYEVPRGHGGERVTVYRRLLEQTHEQDALYIQHQGRLVRMHPVDLSFNATSGRARRENARDDVVPAPAKSASTLSFERTYGSMLNPDGGYPTIEDQETRED